MTSLTLNTHDIHTNPTSRLALMSHQQAATFHFTGPNMLIIHQQTPEQKKKLLMKPLLQIQDPQSITSLSPRVAAHRLCLFLAPISIESLSPT